PAPAFGLDAGEVKHCAVAQVIGSPEHDPTGIVCPLELRAEIVSGVPRVERRRDGRGINAGIGAETKESAARAPAGLGVVVTRLAPVGPQAGARAVRAPARPPDPQHLTPTT